LCGVRSFLWLGGGRSFLWLGGVRGSGLLKVGVEVVFCYDVLYGYSLLVFRGYDYIVVFVASLYCVFCSFYFNRLADFEGVGGALFGVRSILWLFGVRGSGFWFGDFFGGYFLKLESCCGCLCGLSCFWVVEDDGSFRVCGIPVFDKVFVLVGVGGKDDGSGSSFG
jgi:hypothetical protein